MEPLIPALTFEQLKQAKKNTEKALKELGIELTSSTTGNLVANMLGYKNWNTAKSLTESTPTSSLPLMSRMGQISYPVSTNNHNITFETMFPHKTKESALFDEIAGEYESYGFDEKEADQLAFFSIQHGIKEGLPIETMPINEALACLTHYWASEVLNFLDEDKKSSKTKFFNEQLDIYSGDMSGDKTLDKCLKAIEVKKDEIDIFKPFLRQLGVGLKDIEVAIERYNENMKNSEG